MKTKIMSERERERERRRRIKEEHGLLFSSSSSAFPRS